MPSANDELPDELKEQMKEPQVRDDAHALVLAYINHDGTATVTELIEYIWRVTGKVKTRGYMHRVLMRLRNRELIERLKLDDEPFLRHVMTDKGVTYVKNDRLIQYLEPKENPNE